MDGYRLNSYFHKDKYSKGGQLNAGPLWDFNLAFGNADYCNGDLTNGWAFQFNSYCGSYWLVPFWWDKMVLDSAFSNKLFCRWSQLKNSTLDTTHVFHLIDSMAADLCEAKTRHYTKWTILGEYTWPNPSPLPDDYPEEVSVMKTWIKNRLAWMDANMYGSGPCPAVAGIDVHIKPIAYAEVFPNPFTSSLKVKFGLANKGDCKIELFNNTGQLVTKLFDGNLNSGMQTKEFDISSTLPKGMYLIKISSQGNQSCLKLIRE